MSAAWRWTYGVVLAVGSLLGFVQRAHGFCFAPELQVSDEFYVSDLVLTGTVIRSHDMIDSSDPGYKTGTFYWVRVDHYFRGKGPMLLRIYSENSTSRFPMDLNQPYVLFLNRDTQQHWIVDNCGNSAIMSKATATMAALQQLPLAQSYIYGNVYFYGADTPCDYMHVTVRTGAFSKTAPVDRDCSFRISVAAGRYEATVTQGTKVIMANGLNYKDIYCFAVPPGGSAGIAFRRVEGADKANLKGISKVDREYKALCKPGRIPGTVFLP